MQKKVVNNFVYGNHTRIFVNTNLGCNAKCSYCYLPLLNVDSEQKKSANDVIDLVEKSKYYVAGERGSLISIGCYSECMEPDNQKETSKLVNYFLKRGNYVQLATKRRIPEKFFSGLDVLNSASKKLWIYVSMPTISKSKEIEKGTTSPIKRIENFALCKKYNINCVLYIKPYLGKNTENDLEEYIKIIRYYNVPVVVGGLLKVTGGNSQTLVGEGRLTENNTKQLEHFMEKLSKYTKVYLHSYECIEIGGNNR